MFKSNFIKSWDLPIPLIFATSLKTIHVQITSITHPSEDEVNLQDLAFKIQGFHNKSVAMATE